MTPRQVPAMVAVGLAGDRSQLIDFTPDTGPDVRARLAEPTTRAALFEAVLAASSDHIYLYDRKGRYLYASPSAARALGLDAE